MKSKMKVLDLRISLSKGWENKMMSLLRFEFCKLRKQKRFYVCTGIMVSLILLSGVTTKALLGDIPGMTSEELMLNAVGNSSFLLIAGIFAALHICEDYEQQTIKNIYARGYTRTEVYFSKLIAVWLSTTLMFLMIILTSLILGNIYFTVGSTDVGKLTGVLVVQYLVCMANISMYFALSSAFRKNGSAIAATIVFPMFVNMVLALLDSYLKLEKIHLADKWISSLQNGLSTLTISNGRMVQCGISAVIYCMIFIAAGWYFSKKVEL